MSLRRRMERAVALLLKIATRLGDGYWLPFGDELVRSYGLVGTAALILRYRRLITSLKERYGERDAHLLLGFAGLWSGCAYCSAGHILASNLLRYRDQGVLLPIDEDEVERLLHTTDDRAIARIRELLREPAYARVLALIERQRALRMGTADGFTGDDPWLIACIELTSATNERRIAAAVDSDPHAVPPLGPVAKDRALRHRYEAARQAERRARSRAAH